MELPLYKHVYVWIFAIQKKEVHRTYLKGQEKVLVLYFQSIGSKIPGIISLKITLAVQFLLFLVQSKVLYMFVHEP